MSKFFNWFLNLFQPLKPQAEEKKSNPKTTTTTTVTKDNKKEEKPFKISKRQNVVPQEVERENKRSDKNYLSHSEKAKNYKKKYYKTKKRPDSKGRKQDV